MMHSDRVTGGGGKLEPAGVSARKMKIYELAKELTVDPDVLVTKAQALGLDAKNKMSLLESDDVLRIKRAFDKERQDQTVTERLQGNVMRRRSRVGAATPHAPAPALAPAPPAPETPAPETPAPETHATAPHATETPDEAPAVARKRVSAPRAVAVRPTALPPVDAAPVVPAAEATATAQAAAVAPSEPRSPQLVEPAPVVRAAEVVPSTLATPARPRTQFELELEAARAQRSVRDAELAAKRAAEPVPEPALPIPPGRPAVGSVIDLPQLRIQITERSPGGRHMPVGRGYPVPTTMPGGGQVRGRFATAQRGTRQQQEAAGIGRKKLLLGKKMRLTNVTTPAEHKRVIKMEQTIAVSDLAHQMGVKSNEILKKLWGMGMVGVTINQAIDEDTAALLAGDFGFDVLNVGFQEEAALAVKEDAAEDLRPRAPVVTIMGHVDHGKTSLLDAIRNTDVAKGEAGGITQHVAAWRVSTENAGDVVFLDTPGHAAFTAMRARGAQATDIVVLVCAADDGTMPQTLEALAHARDAKVPVIVAVSKCDKPQANPDRVRQQLSEHGLQPEEWGGQTMFVNVSAYTKVGLDKLLEAIQLQAELLELKANPDKLAKGVVIEAKLDKNRGPTVTVLMQEGTLRIGDIVVVGEAMGKVRAMLTARGGQVTEAGPSMPIDVLGLDGVPDAGDFLNALDEEKTARTIIDNRRDIRRKRELQATTKVSLENILEKIQEGQAKEVKIVLKTDVQGSAEALREALVKLSTAEVKVNVIHSGVGGITESDVNLAQAGGAVILGFHVRPAGKSASLAERERVDIKLYNVIYEALDDVKKAMLGMLAPVLRERPVGRIEIRQTFTIPKIGTIAGCSVIDGKVSRQAQIRLVRDSVQLWTGRLASLKRFKDDVREVLAGYECGLSLEGHNDLKVGDIVEAYEIIEEAPTL